MKLLGDRLLISPLPVQQRSEGGMFLPQGQVGDAKLWWRVEAVGPGARNKHGVVRPVEFAVGDTVLTPLHFTHTTLEDGTKIVECDQIIARLE
jgi:co-chaperonin GroES (HSP10)